MDDRPRPPVEPTQLAPSRPSSRHNHVPNIVAPPKSVTIHPQTHPIARPLPVSRPQPVQPSIPPPRPIAEPPILEEITVKYHASVPEKVKKLQALSTALFNFGGMPGTAKAAVPPEENKKVETKKPKKDGMLPSPSSQRLYADLFLRSPR